MQEISLTSGEVCDPAYRERIESDEYSTIFPLAPGTSWRWVLLALAGLLAGLIGLYWSTVSGILRLWNTGGFSHGFLIVPTSLYLIWLRREQLTLAPPAPCFWALPLTAISAFGWLVGSLTATLVIQQFCLVAMIITLFWSVAGSQATKTLLLPLGLLFFAVPFGDSLIPRFQDLDAWSTVKLLNLFHIPVLREGRFLSVAGARWEVAEACSGMRFLTASLALGYLFAGLVYRNWMRRVVFIFVAAIVPIVANVLRIFGIVWVGYLRGQQSAVGVDHLIYGGVFFAIVTAILFAVGFWWREKPEDNGSFREDAALPSQVSRTKSGKPLVSAAVFIVPALALLVVGAGPLSARFLSKHSARNGTFHKESLVVSPPWNGIQGDLYNWKPAFLRSNAVHMQAYSQGDRTVKLYVAYYDSTAQAGMMVSSENRLFDRQSWRRTGEADVPAAVAGQSALAHKTLIRSEQNALVVWNWYWVNGKLTESRFMAKLLLLKAQMSGDKTEAAAIVVATEDLPRSGQADDVLKDFVAHLALK